jgi:hypothetical protein
LLLRRVEHTSGFQANRDGFAAIVISSERLFSPIVNPVCGRKTTKRLQSVRELEHPAPPFFEFVAVLPVSMSKGGSHFL